MDSDLYTQPSLPYQNTQHSPGKEVAHIMGFFYNIHSFLWYNRNWPRQMRLQYNIFRTAEKHLLGITWSLSRKQFLPLLREKGKITTNEKQRKPRVCYGQMAPLTSDLRASNTTGQTWGGLRMKCVLRLNTEHLNDTSLLYLSLSHTHTQILSLSLSYTSWNVKLKGKI